MPFNILNIYLELKARPLKKAATAPSQIPALKLCIDASNIRGGGGLTHLIEFLLVAKPLEFGFSKVVLWASKATLAAIGQQPWLDKRHDTVLDGNYLRRAFWQKYHLGKIAKKERCDLLYVPGGAFTTSFRPIVTMNRNLLPFDRKELLRYGISLTTLRLLVLRFVQSRSIKRANGTIFLTDYAKKVVLPQVGFSADAVVIPHGIDKRFFCKPRIHRSLEECTNTNPLRLVYVSIVDVYKHQCEVAEAVAMLRAQGLPVVLDLIGPAYAPSLNTLQRTLDRIDGNGETIRYHGAMPYAQIQSAYRDADLAIFASSCETFGQIVTEYMAAGLPIACSSRSAMPELLGDSGLYFDPEDPKDIARTLIEYIMSPELREEKAEMSYRRSHEFSWERCAAETFAFLSKLAKQ